MTCYPFNITIVKKANGNIFILNYDLAGEFVKSLSPDIIKIECNENDIVKVILDNGSVEYFDPSLVAELQIEPALPTSFVGDCIALAETLSIDFFYN